MAEKKRKQVKFLLFLRLNKSVILKFIGNMYIIDFKQNLQIRNNNKALRRKIKREKLIKIDELAGVAGIRLNYLDELSSNLNKLNI
jgi:hypothetical protein